MKAIDYRRILDACADAVVAADGTQRIVFANAAALRLLGWTESELLSRPVWTLVPERLRPAHREGIQRYTVTRQAKRMGQPLRVPVLHRDGSELDIELKLGALPLLTGDPLIIASMRDLRGGVDLERQLTVTRYLKATTRAAAQLGSRLDLDAVLETVVATLVADFDAALARVWLYEPETDLLHLRAGAGPARRAEAEPTAPVFGAEAPDVAGAVARARQAVVCLQPAEDHRFDPAWIAREGIVSVAGFPLRVGNEVRGVLVLFSRQDLSDEVLEVLTAFAAVVAATLKDVWLFAREQAARVEAEDQRSRLQTILDVLPMGVMLVEGPESRVSLLNSAGRAIWGGELAPQPIDQYDRAFPVATVDGREVPADRRPLRRALERGERVQETLRPYRSDGKDVVLEVTAGPFPGGGAVATFRDVTARLRLESELAERAAQIKALLDHLPVGVAYFDDRGVCRACNELALQSLGRTPAEAIGAASADLFATHPALREAVDHCAREKAPHALLGIPWPNPLSRQGTRYLDWRFEPLPSESSQSRGALALIVDVTERNRAETELRLAKEGAEQTARRKTQFLSAISHELRTPVNALSLQAELLIHLVTLSPCQELTELVDDIRQVAANLVELLNDLLDLTRFDSGAIEHHPTDFLLDEWLVSTLGPLGVSARAKGVNFEWQVDQPGRIVHADRVKLGRVLTNLVGNAVKFTESGTVSITAGADPQGWLALNVTDTGPGIPREMLQQIFDEFAQLRNPERDRSKGTGLGLAICRRLVEGVGGRLSVQSEPGQGSTFTVLYPPDYLPVSDRPGKLTPVDQAPAPILLIEDDSASREPLARLLEHEGYQVLQASSGPEALDLIAQFLPALVLLDLMLPGMNGEEVLRRLRARPDGAHLSVAVLTGDLIPERLASLQRLGVAGILSKPVNLDDLLELVERHAQPDRGPP